MSYLLGLGIAISLLIPLGLTIDMRPTNINFPKAEITNDYYTNKYGIKIKQPTTRHKKFNRPHREKIL